MTTRKRASLVILSLLLVLIGASGWSVYGAWRQAQKNADLIAAIKRNDVEGVEILLQKGADPNARDTADSRTFWQRVHDLVYHRRPPGKGTPALVLVLDRFQGNDANALDWKPSNSILLFLLKHGANPNVQDALGMTSLEWGCARDDKLIVQMALTQGAKVNAQDKDGWTPLMCAVTQEDVDAVRILLANSAEVNLKTGEGDTALLRALCYDDTSPAVVKMLVEHGADVNAKNNNGDTPLKAALQLHRLDQVSILKQYGAKQ